MLIEITYNVTDVYMSTTETPVYVEISFEQPGGTSAVWGSITGTLSNQTDLQNALNAKFDDPTGTTAQYLRGDGSLATFPSLTSYVPYTGATTNVDLGEYELKAGQLTLDVSPTGTAAVGTTRWNDTTGVSETTLKGGNVLLRNGVDLVARVVNKVTPNTTLTKAAYQAVRVSGAQGQRLAVAFAQANNDANSADTIGLVIETIPTNQEGFIMAVGQLENINTTGSLQGETWVDGDVLYLSPTTAGAITKVKPTGNGHIVVIGYVEYAHANNGKIYVKVMNGWELDELHDVSIVSVANNEALIYESATSLWKNKSISTALGYTPANAATTLTINGVTYDLSTSRTWTIAAGISGSGASGQVTYWSGSSAVSGSNNLFWDASNSVLGVGTNTPNTNSVLHANKSQNNLTSIFATNNNAGTAAHVGFRAGLDPTNFAVDYISMFILGANWPTGTLLKAKTGVVENFGSNFVISNYNNSEPIVFSTSTSRTERMRIAGNGNVGINTASDPSVRFQVVGDTLLRGSGATSATTALTVQDTDAVNMFRFRNDGRLYLGGNANAPYISNSTSGNPSKTGTNLLFYNFTSNQASSTGAWWFAGDSFTHTSGSVAGIYIEKGLIATSGTATYSVLQIQPTINQTGGANGTTRGLYVNPTLTAAADWRSIEWSNNTGWGLYGAGTANNYLGGNLLLGSTTSSGERLQVTGDVKVTGSGATSGTTSLRVQNSSATNLLTVQNNGVVSIPLQATIGTIQSAVFGLSNTFRFTVSGLRQGGITLDSLFTVDEPSGNINAFAISHKFISATGSFTNTSLLINPTINQTGTSSGISRAIYVNPSITTVVDFRAIETSTGGAYINTTSVNASAILQADSTTKGFLPPRMTNAQRTAISSPAAGLVVYDTTDNKHYGYNGTTWNAFY